VTETDEETKMSEQNDDVTAGLGAEGSPTTPVAPPSAPDLRESTAAWPAPAPSTPGGRAPIRWGGVVWGLLLMLFSGATLYVLASAERAADVALWLRSLTPGSACALAAAALGLIIVVSALLGGIRASQRRRVRPHV
jgi:hypothetical protein